jgi:hypothetical protein
MSDRSLKELKLLAKEKNISGYSRMSKDELIELLEPKSERPKLFKDRSSAECEPEESLPNTKSWIKKIVKKHYPEKTLPRWVDKSIFYKDMEELLLDELKCDFIEGDSDSVYIGKLLFPFYSSKISELDADKLESFLDSEETCLDIPSTICNEIKESL